MNEYQISFQISRKMFRLNKFIFLHKITYLNSLYLDLLLDIIHRDLNQFHKFTGISPDNFVICHAKLYT